MSSNVFFDLKPYFNKKPTSQVICAFCFGLIFGPYSKGLFVVAITKFLEELGYLLFADDYYSQPEVRAGVISASISGWIIGRTISGFNVVEEGVPEVY